MSYLMFLLIGYLLVAFAEKAGFSSVDESIWICLSILTAGEVISWRCRK